MCTKCETGKTLEEKFQTDELLSIMDTVKSVVESSFNNLTVSIKHDR